METNKQKKDYILKNCVDKSGDIDLSNLDFTDDILPNGEKFKGTIYLGGLKTNGNLYQDDTDVGGNLYRGDCKVKGNLWQANNIVKGKTYNDFDKHNRVMIWNDEDWVEDKRYIKNLEELTKEQLIMKIRESEKIIKELESEINND